MMTQAASANNRLLSLTPQETRYYLDAYRDAICDKSTASTAGSKGRKGVEALASLDEWYQGIPQITAEESPKNDAACAGIRTKADLVRLMRWKLAREKFRPTLMSLIESNTETVVQEVLERAYASLPPRTVDATQDVTSAMIGTMKVLAELRGVGPATASAITAAWHPLGIFQSDELATLLLPLLPRTNPPIKYDWKYYSSFYPVAFDALRGLQSSKGNDAEGEWCGRTLERLAWSIVRSPAPDLEEANGGEGNPVVSGGNTNVAGPDRKPAERKRPPKSTPGPKSTKRIKRSPRTQT